jgi:hypothetical protein
MNSTNHWNRNTESLHFLAVGGRVEAHPATDAWMSGDRYGTITKIGRKYVHVQMDRSNRVRKFSFDNVMS